MKRAVGLLLLIVAIAACTKEKPAHIPEGFLEILKAHGGLSTWQKARTLHFVMDSTSTYVTDVQDRRERIEAPDYTLGFNGENLWLKADTSFSGDAKFLKNLMFYFYAMPFVLADPGIHYEEKGETDVLGKIYKVWRITFNDSIGLSPKDEYYVYADPKTMKMKWLAYTVTYFSGEKSDQLGWISYDDWQKVNELELPSALTWYTVENNRPKEPRKTRRFTRVDISEQARNNSFYSTSDSTLFIKD